MATINWAALDQKISSSFSRMIQNNNTTGALSVQIGAKVQTFVENAIRNDFLQEVARGFSQITTMTYGGGRGFYDVVLDSRVRLDPASVSQSGRSGVYYITFGRDDSELERYSLAAVFGNDFTGDGIKNIIALLETGYQISPGKEQAYGYWHTRITDKGEHPFVMVPRIRHGLMIIAQAIMMFNHKYASSGIIIMLNPENEFYYHYY